MHIHKRVNGTTHYWIISNPRQEHWVMNKLVFIKTIHTIIWLFFNLVIFYLLYAVINNSITEYFWIGAGMIVVEGIVLLIFRGMCPLTVIARKYSNSTRDNFDIFLPNWLAKHNKLIYSAILLVVVALWLYRLLN